MLKQTTIYICIAFSVLLTACATSPERGPFRDVVLAWNNYEDRFTGQAHLMDNGNRGTFSVATPAGQKCSGSFEYSNQFDGFWNLTCSNGRTVGGKLFGKSGKGKDDLGNSVSLVISE